MRTALSLNTEKKYKEASFSLILNFFNKIFFCFIFEMKNKEFNFVVVVVEGMRKENGDKRFLWCKNMNVKTKMGMIKMTENRKSIFFS